MGAICDRIDAEKLEGKHTVTYNGTVNGAMVFNIDFRTLLQNIRLPSSISTIYVVTASQ